MNSIKTKTICPVCNKERSLQIKKVVSKKNGRLIVYNTCPYCTSAFLVAITHSKNGGMVVVETLTDFSYEEALEVMDRQPLSAENVLEVYQELNKV